MLLKIRWNIVFSLTVTREVMNPTRLGPLTQPTSPASARYANIAVPPFLKYFAAKLKTPGHMSPTDKPVSAHPINDITGFFEKTVTM